MPKVFNRIEFRAIRRQSYHGHIGAKLKLLGGVESSLVPDHDCMNVWVHLLGKLLKKNIHHFCVDVG